MTRMQAWATALAAIPFVAIVLGQLGYVPVFDARIYADCVVDAATHAFGLESLRCAEHPSHAYVALLTAAELFARGSYVPMLLVNAALGVLAVAAFVRILTRVFPNDGVVDRVLLTVCFAVHPLFVSSAVQLNLDFAVLVFLLCALDAVLAERWGLVALWGVMAAFSKETGVILLGGLIAVWALVEVVRNPGSLRARVGPLRRAAPAVVPFVLLASYLAYRALSPAGGPMLWKGVGAGSAAASVFSFDPTDRVFLSYLSGLFIVGFAWIPAAVVAVDGGIGAVRAVMRRPRRTVAGDRRAIAILALAFVAVVFLVTRYRTFSNYRYVAPAVPLLLFAFGISLRRLGPRPALERALIGVVAAGLLISNFRTVDPLARAVYGTFAFGEHEILTVTSITRECCGHGRDQLAYNLEINRLHELQDAAFEDLRPTTSTVVVVEPDAHWFLLGQLDAKTSHRTLRRAGVIQPVYVDVVRLARDKPAFAYYLAFPFVRNDRALAFVSNWYEVAGSKRYSRSGYELDVIFLRRRGS
jgi:hypothetical protein